MKKLGGISCSNELQYFDFWVVMDVGGWKQIGSLQAISMRRHIQKKDLNGLMIQRV